MKTFLEIISETKSKYKITDELIIFEIIYFLSKNVKTKIDFTINKNLPIDFSPRHFRNFIKQYYVHKKPLAHILGKTLFYNTEIIVKKKILAPRPETELLCEHIIKILKKDNNFTELLDVCCGTGNIGIAIKKHIPGINITSLDINTRAIKNTKINLKINDLTGQCINQDFFLFSNKKHLFDVVVANPPYVKKEDVTRTLTRFESKISFINSKSPLDFYRAILNNIPNLIKTQDHFLIGLEFGYDLKNELFELVKSVNLDAHAIWLKDYSNIDRFLIIYKNK